MEIKNFNLLRDLKKTILLYFFVILKFLLFLRFLDFAQKLSITVQIISFQILSSMSIFLAHAIFGMIKFT